MVRRCSRTWHFLLDARTAAGEIFSWHKGPWYTSSCTSVCESLTHTHTLSGSFHQAHAVGYSAQSIIMGRKRKLLLFKAFTIDYCRCNGKVTNPLSVNDFLIMSEVWSDVREDTKRSYTEEVRSVNSVYGGQATSVFSSRTRSLFHWHSNCSTNPSQCGKNLHVDNGASLGAALSRACDRYC